MYNNSLRWVVANFGEDDNRFFYSWGKDEMCISKYTTDSTDDKAVIFQGSFDAAREYVHKTLHPNAHTGSTAERFALAGMKSIYKLQLQNDDPMYEFFPDCLLMAGSEIIEEALKEHDEFNYIKYVKENK